MANEENAMGNRKFKKETVDSAIKDMERICSKYGISPTYLATLTMKNRGRIYKKVERKFTYGFSIPEEKKIRKSFPKDVEDFISANLDRPTSEIVDMLIDKFPNIGKPRHTLCCCVYYRKNREEYCRFARERHSQDPVNQRKRCVEYYHNRLKTVGIYTKKQKTLKNYV